MKKKVIYCQYVFLKEKKIKIYQCGFLKNTFDFYGPHNTNAIKSFK